MPRLAQLPPGYSRSNGATKIVIAASAIALNVAVESRPLVGVCIVDRISGGLSDLGWDF